MNQVTNELEFSSQLDLLDSFSPLEQKGISFGRNLMFQRKLAFDFRVYLSEDAEQEPVDFDQANLLSRPNDEVVKVTTSPLAQVIFEPDITWRPVVSHGQALYEVAEAKVDEIPRSLYDTALFASLRGLPFVSPHGVGYVDNLEDGEAGHSLSANLAVGHGYASLVISDARFSFLSSASRKQVVHTNLINAVMSGLGWHRNLKSLFVTQLRLALINIQTVILQSEEWQSWFYAARYIMEDLNALLTLLFETRESLEDQFIGDLFMAQALARWLHIIYGINVCLITPAGSASTHSIITDSTVVLAWEPASRTWVSWSRSRAPSMTKDMMSTSVVIPEWENAVADAMRGHVRNLTETFTIDHNIFRLWREDHHFVFSCPQRQWLNVFVPEGLVPWFRWVNEDDVYPHLNLANVLYSRQFNLKFPGNCVIFISVCCVCIFYIIIDERVLSLCHLHIL